MQPETKKFIYGALSGFALGIVLFGSIGMAVAHHNFRRANYGGNPQYSFGREFDGYGRRKMMRNAEWSDAGRGYGMMGWNRSSNVGFGPAMMWQEEANSRSFPGCPMLGNAGLNFQGGNAQGRQGFIDENNNGICDHAEQLLKQSDIQKPKK